MTPEEREARNLWIKKQHKAWQVEWHDLFDQDAALLATGEFDRDDPLPTDLNGDFRLIFGLSRASVETRARCFALFPEGDEMHRRFEHYMSGPKETLDKAEAMGLLAELGRAAEACGPSEPMDWSAVSVMDRNALMDSEKRRMVETVSVLFEHSEPDPVSDEALSRRAAEYFLGEPLYAACGNYFELRDWVTGAMCSPELDRVRTLCYRLWDGGWQPLLAGEGILLVRDTAR